MRDLVWQILMLVGICFSQQSSPANKDDSPLIDQQKPSVYLSFKKYEKLTSKYVGNVQVVWLDIQNNTRWHVSSSGWPDEFGGSGWCYTLVTDDGCRTPIYASRGNCGDVISVAGAAPGQAARLAVPAEDLGPGLAIKIAIHYQWEQEPGVSHVAFFGHSNLPEAVRIALPFAHSIPRPQSPCIDRWALPDPPVVVIPAISGTPSIEIFLTPAPKPLPPVPPAIREN